MTQAELYGKLKSEFFKNTKRRKPAYGEDRNYYKGIEAGGSHRYNQKERLPDYCR